MDLFVVKESTEPRIKRERELRRLLAGSGLPPLDVLVYTPEETEISINQNHNLFVEDIVRNGRVVYSQLERTIRIARERPLAILMP